jgi:pimeloyl-ACP methyl ester carboxylesterase
MATFAFIHGASDVGWYWHLVEAELRKKRQDTVAPDLPCDDDSAGLSDYADTVLEAIGDRRDVVAVAQSAGAFTAPLVCDRTPVELLVLVAGLIPQPGEAGRDWWTNTGYERASDSYGGDVVSTFYHDVPPELAAEALERGRDQSDTPGEEPWPLAAWPDVDTRFLLCRNDRFLPEDFMRRVVRERLGIAPDEIESGHCPALSRPKELAERLDAYRR